MMMVRQIVVSPRPTDAIYLIQPPAPTNSSPTNSSPCSVPSYLERVRQVIHEWLGYLDALVVHRSCGLETAPECRGFRRGTRPGTPAVSSIKNRAINQGRVAIPGSLRSPATAASWRRGSTIALPSGSSPVARGTKPAGAHVHPIHQGPGQESGVVNPSTRRTRPIPPRGGVGRCPRSS
jgi:hypothetical protein